jgi:hypothetical protein
MLRFPRWLVWFLVSVSLVALVAVPVWLWIAMPRRTAEFFVAAVEARDADRMNALLSGAVCRIDPGPPWYMGETLNVADMQIVIAPSEWADLLRGRQTMIVKTREGFDVDVRFCARWRDVTMDATAFEARVALQRAAALRARQQFQSALQRRGAIPAE